MQEWRIRGYVRDSDDEDESGESQNLPRSKRTTQQRERSATPDELSSSLPRSRNDGARSSGAGSVRQELRREQAEIHGCEDGRASEDDADELGFDFRDNVQDGISGQAAAAEGTEDAFGPLDSDGFMALGSSPPIQSMKETEGQAQQQPQVLDSLGLSINTIDDATRAAIEEQLAVEEGDAIRQRHFRQRKAIQLHPYQILDGRYQKEMRAAGLVPTRVVDPSSARQKSPTKSSESESSSDGEPPYRSPAPAKETPGPQMQSSSATPRARTQQRNRRTVVSSSPRSDHLSEGEDTLPALNELLKSRNSSARVYVGSKRRKLTHNKTHENRQQSAAPSNEASSNIYNFHDDLPAEHTPLQMQPTPSGSSDASPGLPPAVGGVGFRFPPGFSPRKPPTPVASSSGRAIRHRPAQSDPAYAATPAPKARQSAIVEIRTASTSKKPATLSISSSSSSSESDSGSENEDEAEENTGQLQAYRRRIKGVLPASWLKLDAQARVNPSKSKAALKLPTISHGDEPQPGLAKRRFRPATEPRSTSTPLLLSSDDDDDQPTRKTTWPESPPPAQKTTAAQIDEMTPSGIFDDDPGDAMEDNAVDFMLPSASRKTRAKPSNHGRKRQTKLTDKMNPPEKRVRLTMTERKRRAGSTSATRRSTTFKSPRLSIVDVLSESPSKAPALPTFLKIARRQAHRQPDQARDRPVRKNIRLQTRQDTEDANAVLRDWQGGKIRRRSSSAAASRSRSRTALAPRDVNIQSKLPFTSTEPAKSSTRSHGDRDQKNAAPIGVSNHRRMGSNGQIGSLHRRKGVVPFSLNRIHNAQLEAEAGAVNPLQDRRQFHLQVQRANYDFAAMRNNGEDPFLNKLQDLEERVTREHERQKHAKASSANGNQSDTGRKSVTTRRRRPRKRPAQEVNIGASEYRQDEFFTIPVDRDSPSAELQPQALAILRDLNPFGIPYARTFDILPLRSGTYFHASTFIGSGQFAKGLDLDGRDLDIDCGSASVVWNNNRIQWGPWNEEISSSVRSAFSHITNALGVTVGGQALIPHIELDSLTDLLLQFFNANTQSLSFSDPIDRDACCAVFLECLEDMLSSILNVQSTQRSRLDEEVSNSLLRLASRCMALVSQIRKIMRCGTDAREQEQRTQQLLQKLSSIIFHLLQSHGFEQVRTFFDNNQRCAIREAGIRTNEAAVESIVILQHVLKHFAPSSPTFWVAFTQALLPAPHLTTQTGSLEQRWYAMFTILPLLEINDNGRLDLGSRFHDTSDNWAAAKSLLSPVLSLYEDTVKVPGSTMNEYLRAALARCHHLSQVWGWSDSGAILTQIFDFFARRNYASLNKEDLRRSPEFLQNLHKSPSLALEDNDQGFHIFLKMLASGLLSMRSLYPGKKLASMAWRWIPNHSRTYAKDRELHPGDLDALRNQHDLLSTLYWALPSGFRPPVVRIQELVDHSQSHIEVCRLNIKTWSSLTKFQLSVEEPVEMIVPFAKWCKETLMIHIAQFRLARTELQEQSDAARRNGDGMISSDQLEAMILRNQNGILSAIAELMAGMKLAVQSAHSSEAVWTLLRESNVQSAFQIFDAKNERTGAVFTELLAIFDAALDFIEHKSADIDESQPTSEESQDYGDWPDMDDAIISDALQMDEPRETHQSSPQDAAESTLHFLLEQTYALLSNVFGADTTPADPLMTRLVNSWTRLAVTLVHRKRYDLDTFIGDHGKKSWTQLRDTDHRQKYGPYFISKCVDERSALVQAHRQHMLSAWLGSLVEREAQLKFQHDLTSALLNALPQDPLLDNLPFVRSQESAKYDISMADFRARRLGLLSTILSNMRTVFLRALRENPDSVRTLRSDYRSLLQHLMRRMRQNYEEVQQSEGANGSYVVFVQSVVEFMQQYTTDICPIDKFFTDPTTFHLPKNDPTYLVGRLKAYDSKLDDPKMGKQLVMFVQTVSERAAVDQEQGYLVDQMTAAVDGPFDKIGSRKGSLRSALFRSIFPSYIEAALDGSLAWIFALPILKACTDVFKDSLRIFVELDSGSSRASALSTITILLRSIHKAAAHLDFNPEMFQRPHRLSTVSLMLEVATACIFTIDYARRRYGQGKQAGLLILHLREFTIYAGKMLLGQPDAFPPDKLHPEVKLNSKVAELAAFCSEKLKQDLQGRWKEEGGRHWVKKGNMWVEVFMEVESIDEGRARLIAKIEAFHEALAAAKSF